MAIQTKQLTDHIWLMDDNGSSGYVVIGSERALVIDTMDGGGNVREIVEGITDKPYDVIISHGHPDHVGGNHFFKKVYIHEKDMELVNTLLPPELVAQGPEYSYVKEGDEFDLGNLHFTIYELPGHCMGEIVLLLHEDRILFTGDSINHHLWMQLDGCYSLEKYLKSLERLDFLKAEADYILHGHTRELENISLFSQVERGIQEILDLYDKGELKDPDYQWFGEGGKIHTYDADGSAICYQENNIRE